MKNKFIRHLVLMAISFAAFCAYAVELPAAATLAQQTAVIPANGLLTANFTQQRHLTGIAKTLTSTGRIILWNGKGLIWDTKTPFANTLLVTAKGLYQIEDGKKTALITGQNNDQAMFNTIAKVLSGNIAAGVPGFEAVSLPTSASNTQTKLVPTVAEIKTMIAAIIIEGSEKISHVTIQRPNGDEDDIAFHNQRIFDAASTNSVITAQERAWFNDN